MYTRVYTTAPRSGSFALLEDAPGLALDNVLRDLRIPHRGLDVGVPEKLLQRRQRAAIGDPPERVRVADAADIGAHDITQRSTQ